MVEGSDGHRHHNARRTPGCAKRILGRACIPALYQLGLDPSDPYPLGYTVADAREQATLDSSRLNGWSDRRPG